jgi:DNA-binding beta-propeller fold protein YncE
MNDRSMFEGRLSAMVLSRRSGRSLGAAALAASLAIGVTSASLVLGADPPALVPSCGSSPSCVKPILVNAGVVSPDGRHLYVLSWEPIDDGKAPFGLVGWERAAAGRLRFARPVACLLHPGVGRQRRDCDRVRGWPSGQADGGPYTAQPRSLAISPDGRHLYATVGDTLTAFARDPSSGAVRQLAGSAGCFVRDIDAAPGCTPARNIIGAGRFALAPDGRSLYVTATGHATSGIAAFARDPDSGALTQLPGEAGCISTGLRGCGRARQINRVTDVLVSPDSRHLYLTSSLTSESNSRGGIAAFQRDPGTGAVTQLPGRRGCVSATRTRRCLHQPRLAPLDDAAMSSDGRAIYSIASFRRSGPRRHPIAQDGSVGRSANSPRLPLRNEEAETIEVGPDGRVFVSGHSFGLYLYGPARGDGRLPLSACWAGLPGGLPVRPCRRIPSLLLGYPGGRAIAPASGPAVYVSGNGGLVIVTLARRR